MHALGQHPDVRHALGLVKEAGAHVAPELDEATIRLSGTLGRGVTQAVPRAIYDEHPRPDGVAYRCRLDDQERRWAVFGFVDVTFVDDRVLSPSDGRHVAALSSVVDLWGLPLPQSGARPISPTCCRHTLATREARWAFAVRSCRESRLRRCRLVERFP